MSADGFVVRHNGRFEINGPLVFSTVAEFIDETPTWLEAAGASGVTIDLKQVSKADSAGLALMVEWLRLAREAKCTLQFVNIPEQLHRLIRISGLENLFPLKQKI